MLVAMEFDAVVLAGGAGRRMAGVLKPGVRVAGVRMVDRVLEAVAAAGRVVVVGPPDLEVGSRSWPATVRRVREHPPGGGPVAAVEAALAAETVTAAVLVIVAGDLPLLRGADVRTLVAAVAEVAGPVGVGSPAGTGPAGTGPADATVGAVYLDDSGRPQWLCGAWRTEAVRARLRDVRAAHGGSVAGAALRELFGPLPVVGLTAVAPPRDRASQGAARLPATESPGGDSGLPPWFDCDTDDDVRRAEEWLRR